nr:hypothetical protein [Halomonas sp.]
MTAIAPIRAAPGHIFFAAKAQTAIAAFARLNNNRGFIDELHWILPAASAALICTAVFPNLFPTLYSHQHNDKYIVI